MDKIMKKKGIKITILFIENTDKSIVILKLKIGYLAIVTVYY